MSVFYLFLLFPFFLAHPSPPPPPPLPPPPLPPFPSFSLPFRNKKKCKTKLSKHSWIFFIQTPLNTLRHQRWVMLTKLLVFSSLASLFRSFFIFIVNRRISSTATTVAITRI